MDNKDKEEEINKIKPPSCGRLEIEVDKSWDNLFVIIYINFCSNIYNDMY